MGPGDRCSFGGWPSPNKYLPRIGPVSSSGTESQRTVEFSNSSIILIPFAPLAFVSQCQCRPSRVLSPLVFFPISTHFTAPPEIPSAPTVLQLGSFHRLSRVEPWDLTADLKSHLQTLYAQSFRITLASSVLPRLLAQS